MPQFLEGFRDQKMGHHCRSDCLYVCCHWGWPGHLTSALGTLLGPWAGSSTSNWAWQRSQSVCSQNCCPTIRGSVDLSGSHRSGVKDGEGRPGLDHHYRQVHHIHAHNENRAAILAVAWACEGQGPCHLDTDNVLALLRTWTIINIIKGRAVNSGHIVNVQALLRQLKKKRLNLETVEWFLHWTNSQNYRSGATPCKKRRKDCSWSRRRPQKVDKRMVLEHTHGLFIT